MSIMGGSPYDFVMNHDETQLERLEGFVHRTFNQTDLYFFIKALQNIYLTKGGLEAVFASALTETSTQPAIAHFKTAFFSLIEFIRLLNSA